MLHLCNWICNSGFIHDAHSGGNISQVLGLNTGHKVQTISMRSRQLAEFPFVSLWLVCKRDCHINYRMLVKDLRALKNAVAGEFSVTSVAGFLSFQLSMGVFMRFREEPHAAIAHCRNRHICFLAREKLTCDSPMII